LDPADPAPLLKYLGPIERMVASSLRNIVSPTRLTAGNKTNVIPDRASAEFDCRFLPGADDELAATFETLVGPNLQYETIHHDIAVETAFPAPLTAAMAAAVAADDPGATVVPYLLPAGTDAKHFSQLGISCFGFAPLRLPATFDFPAAFHGVDERVPVEAFRAGVRVLEHFFARC
jgi:acetylornithine deacetylase/succinyl-diaminopimelate desuccinylase-like protein